MADDVRDRIATRSTRRALASLTFAVTALCSGYLAEAAHAPAPPQDEPKPPELVVHAGRAEIALDGDFAEGTARRLRTLLRSNPAVRALSFDSDGGLVDEAEQIGDIVAANGLVTVVRAVCVSACTLAYVRGRERFVQEGARLGFHAPWVPSETGGEQQVPSDDERLAYVAAGIAPDFVAEALAVPSSLVWYPESDRLIAAGVVTAVLPDADLATRLAGLAGPRRLAAAPE